jgi:CRP-like cAMP-binding protein
VQLDPAAFIADSELIEALEKQSSAILCGADRLLFRQGDAPAGLYILRHGVVTLSMTGPAGEEVMSLEAPAGSLLGLPGLIGNEPYTLSAIARKDAELRFVAREDFTGLMKAAPLLALKVLQVLAAEVRSARQAIRGM